jgi:uncharacterized protein (TIGR02453 family)
VAFTGFPDEALMFYEGLEADNSKAYWEANKAVYDSAVAGPMKALLAELAPAFGEAKVFRPYRDVRFSKDKTPYKTRQYALVEGSLYVGIDAHGLHVGGGQMHLEKEALLSMRSAIDGPAGRELERILTKLLKGGFSIGGEQLKRVPRPYDPEHPRADLLRHKALIAYVDHEPADWLHTPAAKDEIARAWKALAPLNAWLAAHAAG